jgi:hypothetical protein
VTSLVRKQAAKRSVAPISIVTSFRENDAVMIIILLIAAVVLTPLCFLGYGTWPNIYGMLSAAKSTWHLGVPDTSRHPGYWTYEAVLFLASSVGGYRASNLLNLLVSLLDVYLIYRLAVRFKIRLPIMAAAVVLVNPFFLIEATSSQDFNMSLLFVRVGFLLLDDRRVYLASATFFLACMLRLSSVVPIGFIYLAALLSDINDKDKVISNITSASIWTVLTVVGYIPSYVYLGWEFYKGGLGSGELWNLPVWAGRFLYKTTMFF